MDWICRPGHKGSHEMHVFRLYMGSVFALWRYFSVVIQVLHRNGWRRTYVYWVFVQFQVLPSQYENTSTSTLPVT
jgi:hypothetical protein